MAIHDIHTTDSVDTSPTPQRNVPTRRIEFLFDDEQMERHYMGGDMVFSHFLAMLSSAFPEGEDFFVRAVRQHRDQVTDADLKRDVAGFMGQEAIHGREHRAFNERLAELGYPTRGFDRFIKHLLAFGNKVLPAREQLAITAALEHYTATFAEILLTDDRLQQSTDYDEVRNLFLWHALEESEHKAVAFDVYRSTGGSEFLRQRVMLSTTVMFAAIMVVATAVSLAGDPAARHPGRLARGLRRFSRNPMVSRRAVAMVNEYYRRDFHPDDHDTTEILATWRERLFGSSGDLNSRLKGRRAA